MEARQEKIVKSLALKAFKMAGFSIKEMERYSWIVVHEHLHGFMPSEYDIREIDEALYLAVLEYARSQSKD